MAQTSSQAWVRKTYGLPKELMRTVRSKPASPTSVLVSSNVTDNADLINIQIEKPKEATSACPKDESSWVMAQQEMEAAFQIGTETAVATAALDPGGSVKKEAYINEAFEVSHETKSDIWSKAKQRHYPGLKLCGTVVSARDIPAMDANGKSDPYCLVSVISESFWSEEKTKKGNISKWQKAGLEASVFKTTVKPATLEPQWNEQFELPIQDVAGRLMVIEVWDSDTEPVGVSEVKGMKGIAKFMKDLKKQDDFIGRGFFSLKDIPPGGTSQSLVLFSLSAKHQKGTVSVHLSIRGQSKGEEPVNTKMDRYMLLFKALVMHESKQGGQSCQKNWKAEMSDAALKLLVLHASYHGISELQQAVVHLCVLCAYHKTFSLQLCAFVTALDCVIANQARPHSSPSTTPPPSCGTSGLPGDWVDRLQSALQGLLTETHDILSNHLVLMDMTTSAGIESLTWWILVMKKVYQFDELVAKLPEDRRSLKNALERSIQASVTAWYQSLCDTSRLRSILLQCYVLKAVSESCLDLCKTIKDTINPAVRKLCDVDYLAVTLTHLDTLLSPAVKDFTERWDQKKEVGVTTSYIMYLNIKSLCDLAKLVETANLKGLQMTNCQRWFKKMVPVWLKVALATCKEKIDKAVEADEISSVTADVRYSSSLLDTLTFLHEMVGFWNNLDWWSPEETYVLMTELINFVAEAAKYYVERIFTRGAEHVSSTDKFSFTTKHCIILNNMKHMQMVLSLDPSTGVVYLLEELKLHSTFEWLQKEIGAGGQARNLMDQIVCSAAEDIEHKISKECELLGAKFIPAISVFITELIQAGEGAKTEQVLSPLGEYLCTNLKTLSSNLLFPTFKNLLEDIWKATVDALNKSVSTLPKKANQKYLYQRLYEVLQFLHGFFNANGEGLSNEQLEIDQYRALLNDLELMNMPTRDLILQCCGDLAEQQAQAVSSSEHKYGELTLSVGYIKETGNIEVTVFQGRNLPLRDAKSRGTYIRLVLLPERDFQKDSMRNRTPLCSEAPSATFNHEFVVPAPQAWVEMKGTIAVLLAYNCDILGKDDFIGLSVVLCADIPQISNRPSLLDESSPKRKNLTFPLFQMGEGSKLWRELTARHAIADSEASDFLSLLNKMCGQKSLTKMLSSSSLMATLNSAVQGAKAIISVR